MRDCKRRINSSGNKKWENGLDLTPVLQESTRFPLPLGGDDIRMNTLQQQLCSPTNTKGMAWHTGVPSRYPNLIATTEEPGLG